MFGFGYKLVFGFDKIVLLYINTKNLSMATQLHYFIKYIMVNVLYILYIIGDRGFYMRMSIVLSGFFF